MTREICFRVFDNKLCRMYWDAFEHPDFDFADLVSNSRFVVMQYTGLKDKNGVKVFEGDIFKIIYSNSLTGGKVFCMGRDITKTDTVFGKVVMKNGTRTIKHIEPSTGKIAHANLYNFLQRNPKEVVGNIYENPSLLSKDTDD